MGAEKQLTADVNGNVSPLRRYIDQTNEIRELSSPQVRDMEGADSYRAHLLQNFSRIGELARDNSEILKTYFFPAIDAGGKVERADLDEMRVFSEELIDAYNLNNLDIPIVFYQARRLLMEADAMDDEARILALDGMVTAAYLMICITARLMPVSDVCFEYYRIGLSAGEKLLAYLERDKFLSLSAEMKELIVINARYIRVVSEIDDVPVPAEQQAIILERMKYAMEMADDPFYREQLPDYNWELHKFRTYEYICSLPDLNNRQGYNAEQLRFINECTKQMKVLYESDSQDFKAYHLTQDFPLYLVRNAYLAGEIGLHEYKVELESMILQDLRESPEDNIPIVMLQAALEYMLVLNKDHLMPAEERCLNHFYNKLIGYMHQTPKRDMLTFLLTCLSLILKYFIEIPSGMDFETMGLSLMAALHPTTYVHSLSVAELSKVLTYHMLRKNPALFIGMPGYENMNDVVSHSAEIENYAYHAALCHDFGKLLIAETIMTYGRDLLEEEFKLIRNHPSIGAYLLENHETTAAYADVARGHHKWYNDKGGYPNDFDFEGSPYRAVIAIIACADCLDAATDTIGRSYKKGKALSEFVEEIELESGTRYAPYLADLLRMPEVRSEIETILTKGRDENYRKAYFLLKKNEIPLAKKNQRGAVFDESTL